MYPNVCCIKKNNKSTIDILYNNTHFQSCMKTRKMWKDSANKYKPIESRVSFSTSSTLTLFRNIRIQRSGIEFTRVCKPTRLRTNSHNALATFHVASRTKKEREREKEKMKRETRGERGTRRIVKIVRDEHVHLFPYLSLVPVATRRNGSPTCNQNLDRKLPMNFFSSPLFHAFFRPLSLSRFFENDRIFGLLAISFAHGVSKSVAKRFAIGIEISCARRFPFRFRSFVPSSW